MNNKQQYEKVYKCPHCGGICAANRMIEHILLESCGGKLTRKLREAQRDGTYEGRETEAMLNTQLLLKEEGLKQLKASYREMKWAIEHDIIEMKKLNEDFLPEIYAQYFEKVF